jgi:hypothetical protein
LDATKLQIIRMTYFPKPGVDSGHACGEGSAEFFAADIKEARYILGNRGGETLK